MRKATAPQLIKAAATAALNAAETLVPEWLPEGTCQGREWVAVNPVRSDSRAGSFSVNLDTGRFNDFADSQARGGDLVALLAYLRGISQLNAARLIDQRLGLGIFNASTGDLINITESAKTSVLARARRLEKEQREAWQKVGDKARRIWTAAAPAKNDHPYLVTKRLRYQDVQAVCQDNYHALSRTYDARSGLGIRLAGDDLLIPICNGRQLVNLQFIGPAGEKRFLAGGRVRGCYTPIGSLHPSLPLYICEGWATGIVIRFSTGAPVACAMNAGNLAPVAMRFRERYGDKIELTIAGDDDRKTPGNPGRTAANDAARAAGGLLVFPRWPEEAPPTLSDFNDLHVWQLEQEEVAFD